MGGAKAEGAFDLVVSMLGLDALPQPAPCSPSPRELLGVLRAVASGLQPGRAQGAVLALPRVAEAKAEPLALPAALAEAVAQLAQRWALAVGRGDAARQGRLAEAAGALALAFAEAGLPLPAELVAMQGEAAHLVAAVTPAPEPVGAGARQPPPAPTAPLAACPLDAWPTSEALAALGWPPEVVGWAEAVGRTRLGQEAAAWPPAQVTPWVRLVCALRVGPQATTLEVLPALADAWRWSGGGA